MKIRLEVEVSDADVEFFGQLNTGTYSWAESATLSFAGIGATPPPCDASWILRSGITFLETNKGTPNQ